MKNRSSELFSFCKRVCEYNQSLTLYLCFWAPSWTYIYPHTLHFGFLWFSKTNEQSKKKKKRLFVCISFFLLCFFPLHSFSFLLLLLKIPVCFLIFILVTFFFFYIIFLSFLFRPVLSCFLFSLNKEEKISYSFCCYATRPGVS